MKVIGLTMRSTLAFALLMYKEIAYKPISGGHVILGQCPACSTLMTEDVLWFKDIHSAPDAFHAWAAARVRFIRHLQDMNMDTKQYEDQYWHDYPIVWHAIAGPSFISIRDRNDAKQRHGRWGHTLRINNLPSLPEKGQWDEE